MPERVAAERKNTEKHTGGGKYRLWFMEAREIKDKNWWDVDGSGEEEKKYMRAAAALWSSN